jgi:hypothetical protein
LNTSTGISAFWATFLRLTLVVAVATGMLLPRMSAVLAELMPGVQTMVICTGTDLITLTIGPDGTPIEADDTGALPHCTLADLIDHPNQTLPAWIALHAPEAPQPAILPHLSADQDRLNGLRLSRAPPVLV